MNILNIWLATFATSLGISTINELRIYKNAADKGYRLNSEAMNKTRLRMRQGIPQNISFLLLIPGLNILNTIKNVLVYEINSEKIFKRLDRLGITEEMTEEEQKIYKEFPIGLTSGLLNVREKGELADCTSVKIDNKNKIYYDLDDEGQFEIYKVTGPLSKKTPNEQIEALKEYREKLLKERNINLTNQPRIRVRSK